MYIPLGDRVLVTKHAITEDFKEVGKILLPKGFQHDEEPPELLRVEAIGDGPACKFLHVGDMVLLAPNVTVFSVFTTAPDDDDNKTEYYIINAASVIGRAKTIRDEKGAEA